MKTRFSKWFNRWFAGKKRVSTVKQAQELGWVFLVNVYGDAINHYNCRSWWTNEYGNNCRCGELYVKEPTLEEIDELHKIRRNINL